ncbi:class E sortase [Streptomyces phaeochromogenes]|uniref:Class E sortase n=1 Tax=Streptomyces phaeochromogenes TaxID=1923 RepID=A0ABZ1HHK3_STRPH|nr:class E sortase [Streptomyces phaeochromogenes]WSD17544.1 class E sortase [Streptomyces phaeochromogenes]
MRVPIVHRVPVVHQQARRRRARYARLLWNGAEVLVTLGVVLLLLVVHQLWWTNRQAREGAERKVQALERQWEGEREEGEGSASHGDGEGGGGGGSGAAGGSGGPGAGSRSVPDSASTSASTPRPRWTQAYAILTIPRLGLRVPVAEGISKGNVLNKGYVGHYPGTAQPGRAGNFALAGHRNTHGEPFRYINRLRRGDRIEVETPAAVYTYVVDRTLSQTSSRDGGVIREIPRSMVRPSYGYSDPGYYLTLTTCTPEYTSKYRLVVWGKLGSMRPR